MNISIRPAVLTDIDWLVKELKEFSKFHKSKTPMFGDEEYVRKTLATWINDHFFRIAESTEHGPVGFIACFVTKHFMNPNKKIMSELLLWVTEARRGSRAGAMLLSEKESWGRANVDVMYMALEENSPMKPESLIKRGWRPHERSFVMEVN